MMLYKLLSIFFTCCLLGGGGWALSTVQTDVIVLCVLLPPKKLVNSRIRIFLHWMIGVPYGFVVKHLNTLHLFLPWLAAQVICTPYAETIVVLHWHIREDLRQE